MTGGRSRSALVIATAALGAALGVALLVIGTLGFARASDTRSGTVRLRHDRRELVARTRRAERAADTPIGRAEQVATSVSRIADARDTVITTSAATSLTLSQAVRLANAGDLDAAHRLYTGEVTDSVRRLDEQLAEERGALVAAQQAVNDLDGSGP